MTYSSGGYSGRAYYIYCYIDPKTHQPMYIGCAKAPYRWKQHTQKVFLETRKTNSPFYVRLYELHDHKWIDGKDRFIIIPGLTKKEATSWEDSLIISIGRQRTKEGPLLNVMTSRDNACGEFVPMSITNRAKKCFTSHKVHGASIQYASEMAVKFLYERDEEVEDKFLGFSYAVPLNFTRKCIKEFDWLEEENLKGIMETHIKTERQARRSRDLGRANNGNNRNSK